MAISSYFYKCFSRYLSIYIRPQNSVVEIKADCEPKEQSFEHPTGAVVDSREWLDLLKAAAPEYILLNGNIHYERDIQSFLARLHAAAHPETRIVFTYYSSLWKPLLQFATRLGLRKKIPEQNWITHDDMVNILHLAHFEPVLDDSKIIMPVHIPFLSNFLNRYIAPLPVFRSFCLVNILMARPMTQKPRNEMSVSVVVPARNEAGNISEIIRRLPPMGPDDELIFIEGNSTDNTWETIQELQRSYRGPLTIKIAQQEGKGKGDAVRKGFMMASKDILMILDADMTVPPESLPLFYRAIVEDKGEFINGSRLVYPMEEKAMRFFNILGNKFFATAFSFVLGQRFKDTLCGTKVLTMRNYLKIAANRHYFGDFDPFGDFDLIFGATRLGLKVRELPIAYKERTYGETNISRWRHGAILLRMLLFAARRIKFV